MSEKYMPELGQYYFGQSSQEFVVSELLVAALDAISTRLDIAMWNIEQQECPSPFENTGSSFECDTFAVQAYNWSDEGQEWNFKWRDLRVSWYKYLGRGVSVNRLIAPNEISKMLDECLDAIRQYEQANCSV